MQILQVLSLRILGGKEEEKRQGAVAHWPCPRGHDHMARGHLSWKHTCSFH